MAASHRDAPDDFKVVGEFASLSKDGKELISLKEGKYTTYRIPRGVENIRHGSLSKAHVNVLYLPKSFKAMEAQACARQFNVVYDITRYDNPIIGDAYLLHPRILFFTENTEWREHAEKIANKRIPDFMKELLVEKRNVRYLPLKDELYDAFGVEYSDDGRELVSMRIKLAKYSIPQGVEEVNEYALHGIGEVTVNGPIKNLTRIYRDCFDRNPNQKWNFINAHVKSVADYEGAEVIESEAFRGRNDLKGDIVIPDSVRRIEDRAFQFCENIEHVIIPDNCEFIGSYAFCDCRRLRSITIPSSLSVIPPYFCQGTDLEDISVPGNVHVIRENAFALCRHLSSVKLSEGLEEIKYFFLLGCDSLRELTIPRSVVKLDSAALCIERLEYLTILSESYSSDDDYLSPHGVSLPSIKEIRLPANIKKKRFFSYMDKIVEQ